MGGRVLQREEARLGEPGGKFNKGGEEAPFGPISENCAVRREKGRSTATMPPKRKDMGGRETPQGEKGDENRMIEVQEHRSRERGGRSPARESRAQSAKPAEKYWFSQRPYHGGRGGRKDSTRGGENKKAL